MSEKLIDVQNLTKHFGTLTAVDDVSLSIQRGDVLGFLGPNGAGKSTTMKMITGFLAPSSGTISVCGHDIVTQALAAKQKIGYLPEGAPAYGEMTPAGFLDFIADIRGLQGHDKQERIAQVATEIHIESVMEQTIETLSKGFKRRVGLAQAILHDPEVLILDEPTDGLDPNQKHDVRAIIQQMATRKGIIISTHILEEVDAVCTRAAIISRGKLLFMGTPSELEARSHYHNAITLTVPHDRTETIVTAMKALPEVADVEMTPPRMTIISKSGASIAAAVQSTLQSHACSASEILHESGHLDEVFRTITTGESGEAERT